MGLWGLLKEAADWSNQTQTHQNIWHNFNSPLRSGIFTWKLLWKQFIMLTFNRFLCLKLTLNIFSIYFSLRLLIWKTLSNSGTFLISGKNWFQKKFFQLIKKKNWKMLGFFYLFEVSRWLNPPDGLHEGVPDNYADVCPGVAVCFLAQSDEVVVRQPVGGGAQVQLEHEGAGVLLWQRNVDPLLKPGTRTKASVNHYETFGVWTMWTTASSNKPSEVTGRIRAELTFSWWPSLASKEYLWLPAPGFHRCHFQRLAGEKCGNDEKISN